MAAGEAAEVRRLIRALEREHVKDADALVRGDRGGAGPTVAARLIERRLAALVDEEPEEDRRRLSALVGRIAEILSDEGSKAAKPLPGWALIEIGPEPPPPNRRIRLGR